MWQLNHDLAALNVGFPQSVRELVETTARHLIFAVTGLYLVFHIVVTARWPAELGWTTWIITLVVVGAGLAGYRLLSQSLVPALLLWQTGLAAAVTLAIYLFQRPEIAFLYALLPLMAMVTVGWPGGLWNGGVVVVLTWWLSSGPAWTAIPPGYGPAVVLASAIAGVIGWVSAGSLVTALQWSLSGFAQARQNMEEARQHRSQLARLLKELDQAYYQLERSNAALVAARQVAEEAERFKTEFVANVSHELRTPLNLIVGYSEMMMTSPESYSGETLPGPYRVDLNAVYHSAQHLLALVDDILDLARIEIGRLSLAREEVDVAWLVTDTANLVQEYIAAKGLDLQVELEPALPAVWIDRLRIRQVLLNLLVNAARHTEQGYVRVSATYQDDEIVVQVQDSGHGIREQDLQKVFEEFRSTEQPFSQWHSGSGLGLPISKKFVELHQGRMGVESSYGKGANFWFTLPCSSNSGLLERPAVDQPAQAESAAGRYRPFVRLGAAERIVVVVHSDPSVITLLKRYLNGYQVAGVADLDEGMKLAEEVKALAVITSQLQNPPRLSGPGAGILTIQCALPNTRQVVSDLGADDLLVKPIGRQELLAAVDRLDRPLHRVLIVDDDPEVVRLFRRMLRARVPVQNCLEAYNGQEALNLLQAEEQPDLVLLDMIMPEVDGHTVLAQMASDPNLADIPVILISTRGQEQVNLHVPGPIGIFHPAGYELGEVIHLLAAMLDAYAPGWQDLDAREPGPAAAPAGSQVSADRRRHPGTGPIGAH